MHAKSFFSGDMPVHCFSSVFRKPNNMHGQGGAGRVVGSVSPRTQANPFRARGPDFLSCFPVHKKAKKALQPKGPPDSVAQTPTDL